MAKQLVLEIASVTIFFFLDITQSRKPFKLLGNQFGVAHPNEEIYCFQDPKRSIKQCDLFVVDKQMQQIVFPLQSIIRPLQDNWKLRHFTDVSHP